MAGVPVLPIKTEFAGPGARMTEGTDIVDEAISMFRANIMFKTFNPNGPADKLIVYLTVFIQKCL